MPQVVPKGLGNPGIALGSCLRMVVAKPLNCFLRWRKPPSHEYPLQKIFLQINNSQNDPQGQMYNLI